MSDVEEIKRRLNIVDVIGEYVKLSKSGSNFRGRCPFHAEKTPSFFVSPEKEIWHCFGGCQKGGDMFRFLMEIEGLEFAAALRLLAGRAGVPIKGFDKRVHDQKSVTLRVNELASAFFCKALEGSQGGIKAREYLEKRKVSKESIERFKLGYAPSSWRALLEFLNKKGFDGNDVLAAGLAVKSDQGSIYDRFRARLMFPITTPAGAIVGFTGRVLMDGVTEAKYVNTPQTLAYDKSRELYGIYQAKHAIKAKDAVIFVEGNLDVVLSCQAGVEHVVATSGTALTPRHLEVISRYTKNVIFCFDADQAGQNAAKRAFEMALEGGFDVQALVLQGQKDPADVVTNQGPQAWQEGSANAIHVMEFLWQHASRADGAATLRGKKAIITEIFSLLKHISNHIERGYWLTQFAQRLSLREEDIIKEFQKFEKIDKSSSYLYNLHTINAPDARQNRGIQDKENLAAIICVYPQLEQQLAEYGDFSSFFKEASLSRDELILKAEIFWPSEYLAKREVERIASDLALLKKKKEMINNKQLTTNDPPQL